MGRRVGSWVGAGIKLFGGVAVVTMSTVPAHVWANPMGEQVVGGAASFNRPDAATLIVNQQTDRAVINWNSFSIASGELTRFVQPSSTSAALNRVVTANPSQIYGTLQANGQVYLINPGGVMVGPGGVVDVAGFVASTHDVGNEEFMRGGNLNFHGNSEASILNQGRVEAREGDVFLVAREVRNEGQLMAKDGTVGMMSGTEVSLQAVGQGNYKIRLLAAEKAEANSEFGIRNSEKDAEIVNEGVIQAANAVLEAKGSYLPMAIKNTGLIEATGVRENGDGTVSLTGGEGDILNTGVVAALQRSLGGKKETGGSILMAGKNVTSDLGSIITAAGRDGGGTIKLRASDTTILRGAVEVVGTLESAKGGQVQLLGERVGLFDQAKVDASGGAGGGEVLVGGDYLGKNPLVPNAKAVVMAPMAEIWADATAKGDGGKVILWSDEYTGFFGEIFTRGGAVGGDGGFVETSSANNLQAFGRVDASAQSGNGGLWLLDPRNVTITTAATSRGVFSGSNPNIFTPTADDATVLNTEINNALNQGTSVTITTGTTGTQDGNILVNAPISKSQGEAVRLTFSAANNITVNDTIQSTGAPLYLDFFADADGNGAGNFILNQILTTRTGDVTISAAGLAGFGAGVTINTTGITTGGQAIAGDVFLRPSRDNVAIGVGTGVGAFTVSDSVLDAMSVFAASIPGAVAIGSRKSGNLQVGGVTFDNKNLSLITGGAITGVLAETAGNNVITTGLLTLDAAGSIGTNIGIGNGLQVNTPRVAIFTEGDFFNLYNTATFTQFHVTTDGTVTNQLARDNQPGNSNLNWLVGELVNTAGVGGDTVIGGISVVAGSVDISYKNLLGDISVLGGGVSSVLVDSRSIGTIVPGAVTFTGALLPGGIAATGTVDVNGLVTITNPGAGYIAAPTITIPGAALGTINTVGLGTLNVQPANNGVPVTLSDFRLSAPLGVISTAAPIFTGGGNLVLQSQDLVLPNRFGSLTLSDLTASVLPTVSYANLGVLNAFEALPVPYLELYGGLDGTPAALTFIGGSFGLRAALLPGQAGAGSISGTGGVLSIEATSASAEGQRVVFAPAGDVPNSMNIGVLETQLMEAPGIRIGGSGTADILLETMITPLIFRQIITTRNPGGNPTTTDIDYDPRYFENPFFRATRNATPPINVRENSGVPHVIGGTVSLVSARGSTRNVQGGDVNVDALSLTGVDGVFFDARSTSGTYAGLNLTTANGSVIGAISARVGRTVQDITVGNGGDITLNLNATTAFVNDGRLPVDSAFSDFSQIQTAGGTATFDAGSGEVDSITVTGNGGMLYTSDPVVTLTGGGVQEASARAVLSGGGVALVAPQIVGAGYTPSSIIPGTTGETTGPTVTINGNGSGVQVGNGGKAFISDDGIISVFSVINGGSGYDPAAPPQVIISGGGSGVTRAAVARTEVNSAGQVVALIVVDPGAGYDNSPVNVLIQAPASGGVRATAELDTDFRPTNFGNSLNPIYISSAGSGYTVEPTVSFSGGGVRQAQARAIVQTDPSSDLFGRVVGFEITDPGDGYISAPTVTIGSGQAFGNFGEYGVSTETVDRNRGSGNISISNGPFPVVGGITLNAPIRTGDALGVPGGDAITGSILLDIYVDLGANSNNRSTGAVPNPGGARGIIITGDASIVPTTTSVGNTRSGSVTIVARDISNGTTAASSLYQLTGSAGLPIQIGTATGGISNLTGNLNASLQLRDITNREVGNLQIYAPAPGEVQVALGNVPLDPNHPSYGPRTSNDLFLSGLSTPEIGTDAGGNQRPDESLVSVEVGGFEGKLTLLRRSESQATATVVNGRVTLITADQGGQLFTAAPNVIVTGGGVTPAEASVFISGGTLIAPNGSNSLTPGNGIDNAGNGYFTVPTVTFTGGGGSGAEAIATISSTGQISSIQIINPGFGYTSLPTVSISAPAGIPASAAATVLDQTISQTSLTVANGGITNPGLGYTTAPLVTVSGGRLGTATATAIVDTSTSSSTYSQITGITINLNGDSFPSGAATITIAQPAGQAQATANLVNGQVGSFTITNPGGGYSSTPSVILTTGTATTPYTLAGDRLGLIADRVQLFDSATPANVLIEAGLVAVAPWTNQRPVNLGSQQAGAASFVTGDLLRFLADDLVIGRRNSSHIGVGAGEITVSAAVGSDSLRISNGLFLAGTRGLSDRGSPSAGLSFPGLSVNVGSEVSLQGSANSLQYLAAIIQGPFAELTEGKSFTLASSLRSSGLNFLPLTVSEIFGNPAYFTGQRFNQGITTQNGNVSLRADLIEQTRLVGFIDTTGGGSIPVSTATVSLAPTTGGRPIQLYATTPVAGALGLRLGNPQAPGLEQIKASRLEIGSLTSGTITLNTNLEFNYLQDPQAPTGVSLISGSTGSIEAGPSQLAGGGTSLIRVGALSITDGGTVSLTGANDVDELAATITGSGSLSFTDINAIRLGAISVANALTITAGGAITQTTDGITVFGSSVSSFNAGTFAITLNTSSLNNFAGPVDLTGATTQISDATGGLVLGSLATGNLTVASNGAGGALSLGSGTITGDLSATAINGSISQSQSGALTITGNSSITAGAAAITLANGSNNFVGTVTLSNIGAANGITLSDGTGDLTIGNVTSQGAVVITATGDGGTLLFNGTYNDPLPANGRLTGSLTARAESADLVPVTSLNISTSILLASFVTFLTDGTYTQGAAVGTLGTTASATLTANSLAQINASLSAANVTLQPYDTALTLGLGQDFPAPAGVFAVPSSILNGISGSQRIFASTSLTLGSSAATGGITIGSSGPVDLSGQTYGLTLRGLSGGVTFANTLTLPDSTNFDLSAGTSTVNGGAGTDVQFGLGGAGDGIISFGSAGNVNSFTGRASQLGASNVTGNLNYTSALAGNLIVGQMSVGGTSSFTLQPAGSLTAANPANAFTGTVTLAGQGGGNLGNVTINNSKALTLGNNLSMNGSFSSTVANGGLSLGTTSVGGIFTATAVGISGGPLTVTGTTTLKGGAGNITLTGDNSFVGSVTVGSSANTSLFVRGDQMDNLRAVQATQNFNLKTGDDINLILPTPGEADNQLSSDQIQNFNVGSLSLTAGSIAVNRAFNFPNIQTLALNSTAVGGGITATAAITVGNLSLNSTGGGITLGAGNQIANLGSVTSGGNFSLVNAQGLNLTGSVTASGTASLTAAGQFYNFSGQAVPFAGVTGRVVVRSLSMMGGLPNQISALAGFTPSYNFTDPGTSRAMIYAVSPLTMFAPNGTVIAGVDLSGTQTGGGQLNTFFTGSDNLNWMIADFGKFNLPKVDPARLQYMLYQQRVEPETRSLPQPVMRELTMELGRPPTVEELQAREVARRQAVQMRTGAILERSSFDEDVEEPKQEARGPVPVLDGGKPQAGVNSECEKRNAETVVSSRLPEVGGQPSFAPSPASAGGASEGFGPQAKKQMDTKRDPKGPILRSGPQRAVALRVEPADAAQIIQAERERAEVHVAPPLAGAR